jgi:hypothetical protein
MWFVIVEHLNINLILNIMTKNKKEEEPISRDLFQDSPVHQRPQLLEDQAYSIEDGKIKKPFTVDELIHFKDQVSTKMIIINDEEAKLDAIKNEFKARIQPHKNEVSDHLKNIRLKYSESDGKIYNLANNKEGEMHMYDCEGRFIGSRRLLPTEKQGSIYSISKAANNE